MGTSLWLVDCEGNILTTEDSKWASSQILDENGRVELFVHLESRHSQVLRPLTKDAGLRIIHGVKASEAINILENIVDTIMQGYLPEDQWLSPSYSTKKDLEKIINLSHLEPEGIWQVD